MNIRNYRFVLSLMVGVLLPVVAIGSGYDEGPFEFNGHWYKVVTYPSGTSVEDRNWDDANAAAIASEFMGVTGHLATITSAGEDAFIEDIRAAAISYGPKEAWVGGFTDSNCSPVPGCGWMWVNGEGSISTAQVTLPLVYSNWQSNEPNDSGGEMHLGVGLGGVFGWNDEGRFGNVGGFIIEYDIPISAGDCAFGGEGCPISVGSNITLPETAQLGSGAEIATRRYEFIDDPALCGTTKRVLFGSLTDPDDLIPDAVLPAYLCGSPNFLVIAAETTDISIPDGTILVNNETGDLFPDNLYDCLGPLNPDLMVPELHPADPQNRDVMAWQSTDLAKMPENDLGASNGFDGSVGEYTFECGSSRGKVNSASYYFLGLHIDFGPGYEYSGNAAGNHQKFVELTRYKLIVLRDVIDGSRPALQEDRSHRLGYAALRRLIWSTIRSHDQGDYQAAIEMLRDIEDIAENLNYTPIAGENHQGATIMRASNGIFMYTDKVIQTAP